MRLIVEHVTRYHYPSPVRSLVQSLRLTPSEFEGQKIGDWQVRVEGARPGACFRDGAGDLVQGWSLSGPVGEVEISARGTIDTRDTLGVLRGHRETVPPTAYLTASAATKADGAMRAAADQIKDDEPLSLAHALSSLVAQTIAYRPGVTAVGTTAAEAFAQGSGVCQDHAQALIALARHRNLPARYVTGYLFADAQGVAHEASHAWAEVHVRGLGWVGFDAANRCCPDERYIRMASGIDAADATPIRGVSRGMRGALESESMEVKVAVMAAEQ